MKAALCLLALLVTMATCYPIHRAHTLEEIDDFLKIHEKDTAVLYFEDTTEEEGGFWSTILSVFGSSDKGDETYLKEIALNAPVIVVDVAIEDFTGVKDKYRLDYLPDIIAYHRGEQIMREYPTEETGDSLEYLIEELEDQAMTKELHSKLKPAANLPIKDNIDQGKEKVLKTLKDVEEEAENDLKEAKQGANEKLDNISNNLDQGIGNAKNKASQNIQNAKDSFGILQQGIRDKVEGNVNEAKQKTESAKQSLDQTLNSVKESGENNIQAFKENANQAKDNVQQKAQNAKESASQRLETTKQDIDLAITDAKQDVDQKVESAKENAKQKATDVRQNLQDNVSQAKQDASQKVKSVKQNFEQGVSDKKQDLSQNLGNLKQKAEEKVKSKEEDIKNNVQDATQNIKEKAKKVHDNAEKHAQDLEDGAHNHLKPLVDIPDYGHMSLGGSMIEASSDSSSNNSKSASEITIGEAAEVKLSKSHTGGPTASSTDRKTQPQARRKSASTQPTPQTRAIALLYH